MFGEPIEAEQIEFDIPPLTHYQKEWANIEQRFLLIEASTKVGKTAFMMLLILVLSQIDEDNIEDVPFAHKRIVNDGDNFWWVAPSYSQARIVLRRMWRIVAECGEYVKNESELYIKTPLGSYIWFKTADKPDNLYGEDVFGVVFDEFTRARQEAWFALRSTLTATKGWCKFIGNYKGNGNWGHQLSLNAETDPQTYSYRKVNAWEAVKAGIIEEEEVLQAQKDLPSFMFKALYLCEGDIDKARWVLDSAIDDLPTNYHVKEEPSRKRYISADIALQGSDKFTIWVWEGKELIDLEVINESNGKEVVNALEAMRLKYKIQASHVVYDADGIGRTLGGFLPNYTEFRNGAAPVKVKYKTPIDFQNLKTQCYYQFAMNINQGKYLIDKEILGNFWGTFVEELEVIKNRNYDKEGKVAVLQKPEIKEIIGRSPDFTDGAMMREFFDLKPQGIGFAVNEM